MEAGERGEEEGGEVGVQEGPARRQGVARAARLYREVVGTVRCRVQGAGYSCKVPGAGSRGQGAGSREQDSV